MLISIIILGVLCALLLVMLSVQDSRNTRLVAENSLMKGRMEGLLEKQPRQAPGTEDALTVDRIMEAVKSAGFVPKLEGTWIRFMIQGEPYFIQTDRLPQIFVVRFYNVDTKEWEMDILRHAAHVMSDDLMMVKATFDEQADENGMIDLRFFVAAMDRNYSSLKDNLAGYIHIIDDGSRHMHEIYDKIVAEKRDAALPLSPFPGDQKENKILS